MELKEINKDISKVYDSPENLKKIRQSYEQVMMAVDFELRRILRSIGAEITPETTREQVEKQMEIMGIEIFHVTYEKSPKFSGWHIFQHKQPLLILCDPKPDPKNKNRIILERKIPSDIF